MCFSSSYLTVSPEMKFINCNDILLEKNESPFFADFKKKTSNDLIMISSFLKIKTFNRRICGSLKSVV
ncbi:hypothetical protein AMJ86_05065 [bacterium SM23_57]|jgi:hypothetical protein|nr:MAG: hypothetical protein AMJ86_05065 [bacterium SM23_57]